MTSEPEARAAQVDAAYRRAVRDAKAAGKPPPKRKSIQRRFQRYAAEGTKEHRRPSAREVSAMRRVYHREERKAASRQSAAEGLRRAARQGARVNVQRPHLLVSPGSKKNRSARVRAQIDVELFPGDLGAAVAALDAGDDERADDEIALAIIGRYIPGLATTDATITRADRLSAYFQAGDADEYEVETDY